MNELTLFWQTDLFRRLLPYLRLQWWHDRPQRIEVAAHVIPADLLAEALAYRGSCVACEAEIRVVRARKFGGRTSDSYYIALTCPLEANIGCSRGWAARDGNASLVAALEG